MPRLRPGVSWLGTLGVLGSLIVSWFAFRGASGEDSNVAFGLYVGAAAIVLMAWSFVLALRPRVLEPLFGGLDRMYRVHRWAGTLSVVAMFLHVRAEPEVDGIRGASKSLADQAEELAGAGEIMLYVLVALSLLRWFPYRWWRWTHKLLGIPYLFACFHFFTAEKPYANGSGWGWWFGGIIAAGATAWLWRVVTRDAIARGRRYRVMSHDVDGGVSTIELEPTGPPLGHDVGQFAFLKLARRGMREPHPFTIASSPGARRLRFVVKDLGDWSSRLSESDITGSTARIEGPYGDFRPEPADETSAPIWLAAGVGITPFLAALDARAGSSRPPARLLYAVRGADSPLVRELQEARSAGLVELFLFDSEEGDRLTPERADGIVGMNGWAGAHVAICGPASFVGTFSAHAAASGARHVETEDFDIRQGFGPDLSREIDAAGKALTGSARGARNDESDGDIETGVPEMVAASSRASDG